MENKIISKNLGETCNNKEGDFNMEELIRKNRETMDKVVKAGKSLHQTARSIEHKYYDVPVVRIFNPVQAYLYLKNGCKMLDTYADLIEEHLVYVFVKEGTKEVYQRWLDHTLA